MASDMDLQAAAELSATPGRLRRSNSDPRLSSSEVQQQPNHLHTPMAKGAASASNGISLQFGGLLNGGPGGVCFEFCGLVCVQPTAMLRASRSTNSPGVLVLPGVLFVCRHGSAARQAKAGIEDVSAATASTPPSWACAASPAAHTTRPYCRPRHSR